MTAFAAEIDRALALHDSGDATAAAAICRQVLAAEPANIHAFFMLGAISLDLGASAEAAENFEKVVALQPDIADAHNHRGTALLNLGRAEEALASYRQAAALAPDNAEYHNNCGTALLTLDLKDDALAEFHCALTLHPDYVEAHYNRGIVLLKSYCAAEALADFDFVIAEAPRFAAAHYNRGLALINLGRFDEALESLDRCLDAMPDDQAALQTRANLLQLINRPDEAAAAFSELGAVRQQQGLAFEFTDSFAKAFHAQMQCCDWKDYDANARHFTEIASSGQHPVNPFSFLFVSQSPAQELACARGYARPKYPLTSEPLWRGERYDHERIRVAYLSSDFRQHAVGYLTGGLFEAHDRNRFEIYGVSFWPDESYMRRRFAASFDRLIDAVPHSDYDIARMLREMEIDIAVHLNGHTSPDRIGILSHRVAPVQVNYLGYPGTMGLEYMDYILADKYVVPREDEPFYSEKIAWLPDCYQVNDDRMVISPTVPRRADVDLPDDAFVFCAFNKNTKVTPMMFDVWMRLLRRVPRSVIWMMENNPAARQNLVREAKNRGVSENQLVFAKHASLPDHLARHKLADLFLDTAPYTAHTTASDSLRSGVPVVTLCWPTFAGRVASSLLHNVGLPELITGSLAEYEDLAYRLATNPTQLSDLKAKLRRNLATAPLFNTARMARHIESAFVTMWDRQRGGELPASFTVPALG